MTALSDIGDVGAKADDAPRDMNADQTMHFLNLHDAERQTHLTWSLVALSFEASLFAHENDLQSHTVVLGTLET